MDLSAVAVLLLPTTGSLLLPTVQRERKLLRAYYVSVFLVDEKFLLK